MKNLKRFAGLLAIAGVTGIPLGRAQGQAADALIDKLVDKGVLTVKEANELREEAEKNFTQSYAVKTGLPDYVSSLKLYGDVRLRQEGFYSGMNYADESEFVDRNRWRYRLRFGATVTLLDNLEAGFRLTSSEASGSFGGDPISNNTTLQDNGSKKLIYFDQAYARWSPFNGPSWFLSVIGGKMENPFAFDEMVFDTDYTPEGFAVQTSYRVNDTHTFKANGGIMVLDEIGASGNDPYLLGGQVRWDASFSKHVSATAGASMLAIENRDQLSNSAVPNVGRGNTRDAGGRLVYDYNPYILDASLTYSLESMRGYNGAFPIKVGGAFMHNPAADSETDNVGWNAGIMFGKASKKRTWELSYTYKWLGADAWYEELPDSDFGAFYASSGVPNSGVSRAGYSSGTNVRGHIFRMAYAPTDSLVLSVKWFDTDTINDEGSEGDMNRVQVDGVWKF